jgi:branched-chain amino acid aminotransferase
MLTEKAAPTASDALVVDRNDPESYVCWFDGRFVQLRDANVSIMTHAFLYGTAVFEGIRAYWNAEQGQLWALKVPEHLERMRRSSRILMIEDYPPTEELSARVIELLRRNGFREDTYVRPSFYKSSKAIGVKLHGLESAYYMLATPFGPYVDTENGIKVGSSSWRRTNDAAIPARGKITGAYVNSAFAKTEANLNGYDEALVLTADGHVSEGSAENFFMVRDGVLITPPVTDDVLEGITRAGIMELAADLGIRVVERSIDRTEVYICDEIFLCGTGAQISPVREVDHRVVGDGRIGPITQQVQARYFDAVRGKLSEYMHWLMPVYEVE